MEQALAKILLIIMLAGGGEANAETGCLALNIYHEARGQSIAGQIAVGQVTLNRVRDSRWPNSVCEVITQGPHRASWKGTGEMIPIRHRCQFSWYCDGKSDKINQPEVYQKIFNLAQILMNQDMIDITSKATHYHADYVQPSWAKTKRRTTKIEDHIFYIWENK